MRKFRKPSGEHSAFQIRLGAVEGHLNRPVGLRTRGCRVRCRGLPRIV